MQYASKTHFSNFSNSYYAYLTNNHFEFTNEKLKQSILFLRDLYVLKFAQLGPFSFKL